MEIDNAQEASVLKSDRNYGCFGVGTAEMLLETPIYKKKGW